MSAEFPIRFYYPTTPPNEIPRVMRKASHLTPGRIERESHFSEDKNTLRLRAGGMKEVLRQEAWQLRKRILKDANNKPPAEKNFILSNLTAVDEGKEIGLDVSLAWPADIVDSLVRGKSIDFETTILFHDPYTLLEREPVLANINQDCLIGINLISLLKKLTPESAPRFVIKLEDLSFDSDFIVNPLQQAQSITFTEEILKRYELIDANDSPGKNYLILPDSQQIPKIRNLNYLLEQALLGDLKKEGEHIYFEPKPGFVETLNKTVGDVLVRGRQYIQLDEKTPFPAALIAAGRLDQEDDVMQVSFFNALEKRDQQGAYTLLRAAGLTRQEKHHAIYFDSDLLTPDLITYSVAKLFERHTQKFLDVLDLYNDWSEFDPYEYAWRNYGEKILPADKQIIKEIANFFHRARIEPDSINRVAEIGTGPNLYFPMLLAPYAQGDIDILEFSSANREFLKKTQAGTIEPPFDTMWTPFEKEIVQQGGPHFVGCENKAKEKMNIQFGNILDISGQYNLISLPFVAESIINLEGDFRKIIQSVQSALTPDGLIMAAHMVGSDEYHAGKGTHFPSVNLSIEKITQAYLDAGMEVVVIPITDHSETLRAGYEGMALVIARNRGSKIAEPYFASKKDRSIFSNLPPMPPCNYDFITHQKP